MADVDFFLASHGWQVIGVWAIVCAMDYCLTIIGARLYAGGAKQYFIFEGSYELTPTFQPDVNALRLISPRFLARLVLSCVVLGALWLLDVWLLAQYLFFPMAAGALLLEEAAIHVRHIRNITLFSIVRRGEGARGQVQYSRWLNLRLSATELLCFSALFLLLFLLGEGWFLLGGALGCGVTGARHWLWSRKAQRLANAQPVEE